MPEFLRRTASIAEGTKYAAVSFIGLQNLFAACALVKKNTAILRHLEQF
jgi:hypothetical protein